MLSMSNLFLHSDTTCLFSLVATLGNYDVGGVSMHSVGKSIPSLHSSPLRFPIPFYSFFFTLLSHCSTSIGNPTQTPTLPILSASGTIVFASSAKISIMVLNGLPLYLFPFIEVVNNLGGHLSLFNLTILKISSINFLYLHDSFMPIRPLNLILTSLLVVSSSFYCPIMIRRIILINSWCSTSIIAKLPLLTLQFSLAHKARLLGIAWYSFIFLAICTYFVSCAHLRAPIDFLALLILFLTLAESSSMK